MTEPIIINVHETALVVIDLQKGIASLDRKLEPYSAGTVIGNSAQLAKAFRALSAPVFLVHVTTIDGKDMLAPTADAPMSFSIASRPPNWSEFVDELSLSPSDIIITKRQWGAFHGTELDLQLRRRGIKTIVLCGISTNIGVETTAREAYQHGYNQIFVSDAMTAMSGAEHQSTLANIFPRIGRTRTTSEVLESLGAGSKQTP